MVPGERWSRQLAIPGFGPGAQERLRKSKVAVLGVGGIGCPSALYLAAAGVGSLVLADGDSVEESNLNRQVLFTSRDLGRPKAVAGAERIRALDPDIDVAAVVKTMGAEDLRGALQGCTFALDCFDRNASRLEVNKASLDLNLPACHGFAQNFSCEVFTVLPGKSACLACALDESFPEPGEFSVLGAATGLAGTAMAAAAIRYITGIGDLMEGCRLRYDLAFPEMMRLPVARAHRCPACGSSEE